MPPPPFSGGSRGSAEKAASRDPNPPAAFVGSHDATLSSCRNTQCHFAHYMYIVLTVAPQTQERESFVMFILSVADSAKTNMKVIPVT